MIQYQNSFRKLWSHPETIDHNGKIFHLIMKGGNIEKKITEYRYDHPENDYLVKYPNGAINFAYLYAAKRDKP